MRREIRLIILVFILVVVPAIAVSFLAARVLGSWQIVLQKRMETDAIRVLDQASLAWEKEKAALTSGVAEERREALHPSRIAALILDHPWIEGLFVFEPDAGLVYPPVEVQATEGTSLPGAHSGASRLVEPSNPALSARAEALLRSAGVALSSGETNQAVDVLKQVVRLNPSSPPRDPEEGFYYDLIALKRLGEITGAPVKEDVLRRVLARYDDLVPLQRDLMVEWVGGPVDEFGMSSSSRHLVAEWRERMRGRELTPEIRGGLIQDLAGLAALVPGDGWGRGRIKGREFLAMKRAGAGEGRTFRLVAIQFDETRLIEFMKGFHAGITSNTGIRVECGVGDPSDRPSKAEVANGPPPPRFASRRLPPPMDDITLTATPADPRTFSLNARLQTRLYRWSGVLLLTSIVAGVWLIWRQAAMEIRQARERSDFAATVSHDLRTPLSSMRMLAESLYMGHIHDEPKKQKFLGAIIKESDRLSRLTDRALYFIRYGQDALRYRFTEGDLGILVKNVVGVFAVGVGGVVEETSTINTPPPASLIPPPSSLLPNPASRLPHPASRISNPASRIPDPASRIPDPASRIPDPASRIPDPASRIPPPVILLSLSPAVPPVRFDEGAMEQVLYNLLDNAVKYSDKEKGVRLEVSLDLAKPSSWFGAGRVAGWRSKLAAPEIVLSVRDHGIGLAPDEVKRILKPYARGRGAARRNARGIGLGLALCHHVVKAHGGRIAIESAPGQGSVFRVMIPVV